MIDKTAVYVYFIILFTNYFMFRAQMIPHRRRKLKLYLMTTATEFTLIIREWTDINTDLLLKRGLKEKNGYL